MDARANAGKPRPVRGPDADPRRAAHLPDETRTALAEGRRPRPAVQPEGPPRDRARVGDRTTDPVELARRLAPAVAAGLLLEHAATHRPPTTGSRTTRSASSRWAGSALASAAIHSAIVELLLVGDRRPRASRCWPSTRRRRATRRSAEFSLEAARGSPSTRTRPRRSSASSRSRSARPRPARSASRSSTRATTRSRCSAAPATASRDSPSSRRSPKRSATCDSASRCGCRRGLAPNARGDRTAVALLATRCASGPLRRRPGTRARRLPRARPGAAARRARRGVRPSPHEADFDGAEEAFRRAVDSRRSSARTPRSRPRSASSASTRPPGSGRGSSNRSRPAPPDPATRRGGRNVNDVLLTLPIVAPSRHGGVARLEEALSCSTRLDDRRGAMSTIIAMGYLNWGADIHIGSDALATSRRSAGSSRRCSPSPTRASARARGQMLYGVTCSPREGDPRPRDLPRRGRVRAGPRTGRASLEFLSAGGTALALARTRRRARGARRWLDRAAATAIESPTPLRPAGSSLAGRSDRRARATPRGCSGTRTRSSSPPNADRPRRGARPSRSSRSEARGSAPRTTGAARGRRAGGSRRGTSARACRVGRRGAQADAAIAQVAASRRRRLEAALAAVGDRRAPGGEQEDLHLEVLTPVARCCARRDAPEWAPTRDRSRSRSR